VWMRRCSTRSTCRAGIGKPRTKRTIFGFPETCTVWNIRTKQILDTQTCIQMISWF
jgi:hypothetical protein